MENQFGVFIWRFCPLHLGHQYIIEHGIKEHGINNFLLIIGSKNIEINSTNIFWFEKRKEFIQKLYPNINIIWLDDYPDDNEWQKNLETNIFQFFNIKNLQNIIFYTGDYSDVKFFEKLSLNIKVLDRFNGPTKDISGTKIRYKINKWENIDKLVNKKIIKLISKKL
jgi:nicotinamide mononucleotide adenylyltransferase